jgi:hypothetical protein
MVDGSAAGLWAAVAASGLYHGINPGMGWPLAVSAGLMGAGRRDVLAALGALAGGHLLAMAAILLPFAALSILAAWQHEVRVAAGCAVVAAGLYLLIGRRHPRFLARIGPTRLAFWSFAVATVHGAGLMLVPVYLGLCSVGATSPGDAAASVLIGGSLTTAIAVALVHAAAMLAGGGALAVAAFEWLGTKAIARCWFNLETVWALSLVLVGAVGLLGAAATRS